MGTRPNIGLVRSKSKSIGISGMGNMDLQESELLVHERREIIGEILKLNPAYKPPADHKPLMKESKIPIPIKEHPGYNFLGSLFGTAADTLKKLEKETGARVKVYGVKADSEGKVEITAADGKDASAVAAYEDLYVHVSADAFEKLDAAVALVELLLTPVSGNNPVSSATAVRMDDDSAEKNVDAQPATTTVVHSQAAAVSAPPPGSSQQAGNPRGLQPSAADFAFHPNHRPPPPIPTSPQVWQNRPLQLQQQPPQQLVRQPQLLPMVHNFNNHGYPRPMMSNEADQPRLPYFTGRPPPPLQSHVVLAEGSAATGASTVTDFQ
ncbi:hypothetical protein M569_01939, partial [Genlisea aurea]